MYAIVMFCYTNALSVAGVTSLGVIIIVRFGGVCSERQDIVYRVASGLSWRGERVIYTGVVLAGCGGGHVSEYVCVSGRNVYAWYSATVDVIFFL